MFSSVQLLSHVQLFAIPWITARQTSLSITNPQIHSNFMSIVSVMPSSHLILCCPLLLLPPIPPSIRVFSNESTLRMRWPKYWSFSFSISPSNEHPGLISFRMDWLDLLAVQGTLKSLLQHHSSKASIIRPPAFFTVQLSHPYMTTAKTIVLTRQTFVGKIMSLLLNMLSRLVITFLPRSKCLLISCLQSPSAVILEPPKTKSATVSPSISHEVMGPVEKAMAPDSSILAWKIPWTDEPGRLQSMGSLRVGHDWATSLSLSFTGEGNGNPFQCSCLENPRDGGAWWAAVCGVAQSRTRLKRLSSSRWDQMPWSLFSECWALSPLFHSPLSLSSEGSLIPLHFLP